MNKTSSTLVKCQAPQCPSLHTKCSSNVSNSRSTWATRSTSHSTSPSALAQTATTATTTRVILRPTTQMQAAQAHPNNRTLTICSRVEAVWSHLPVSRLKRVASSLTICLSLASKPPSSRGLHPRHPPSTSPLSCISFSSHLCSQASSP